MVDTVRLKGEFDKRLHAAFEIVMSKPKTWTLAQSRDLNDICNAIYELAAAVSEMAARVRDD